MRHYLAACLLLASALLSVAGPFGHDARTNAFSLKVKSEGVTLSAYQQESVAGLVMGINRIGWSKYKALYPFIGGTAGAHSVNLIDPATFQITWSGTVTHDANGITGNGTTGYGNTGFNPVAEGSSLTSFHISAYRRTIPSNGTFPTIMGNRISSGDARGTAIVRNVGSSGDIFYMGTNIGATASNSSVGLFLVNVEGDARTAYANLSVLRDDTDGTNALANRTITLLALNSSTAGDLKANANLSLASIGMGLDAEEVGDFNEINDGFQSCLNRKVP